MEQRRARALYVVPRPRGPACYSHTYRSNCNSSQFYLLFAVWRYSSPARVVALQHFAVAVAVFCSMCRCAAAAASCSCELAWRFVCCCSLWRFCSLSCVSRVCLACCYVSH